MGDSNTLARADKLVLRGARCEDTRITYREPSKRDYESVTRPLGIRTQQTVIRKWLRQIRDTILLGILLQAFPETH